MVTMNFNKTIVMVFSLVVAKVLQEVYNNKLFTWYLLQADLDAPPTVSKHRGQHNES